MAIQPYQQRIPLGRTAKGEDVFASVEFVRYISEQVFARIGGDTALNNNELQTLAYSLVGYQQHEQQAALPPDVVQPPECSPVLSDVMQPGESPSLSEMTFQC